VSENKQTIDERFTAIADKVSEGLGAWWFTVVSLIVLFLWILYGAFILSHLTSAWFTSSQWNFPLNTITTVGEWFIGALVAAAANRVERRHELLLREIKGHTRADEATTKRDAEVNKKSESEIAALREDIKAIKEAVLK
jgi:uncharacterized membrane protein